MPKAHKGPQPVLSKEDEVQARRGLLRGAVTGYGLHVTRRMSASGYYLVVPVSREEAEALSSVQLISRWPEGVTSRNEKVGRIG